MKRALLVEVDCEEKNCGDCPRTFRWDDAASCSLFGDELDECHDGTERCSACLAAEDKAKEVSR